MFCAETILAFHSPEEEEKENKNFDMGFRKALTSGGEGAMTPPYKMQPFPFFLYNSCFTLSELQLASINLMTSLKQHNSYH